MSKSKWGTVKEAWLQIMFSKDLEMTSGSLTLMCARGRGRARLEERWNYATAVKQTKKCTIYRAVKSFLNCNAKGTCSSRVTEAAATSQSTVASQNHEMQQTQTRVHKSAPGRGWLSRGSPLSSSCWLLPSCEHSTQSSHTQSCHLHTTACHTHAFPPPCCSVYTVHNPRKTEQSSLVKSWMIRAPCSIRYGVGRVVLCFI